VIETVPSFTMDFPLRTEGDFYFPRWTLPTSSGKQSASLFLARNGRALRQKVDAPGVIRVTCCTGFFGCLEPVRLGRTCPGDIRRTQPATDVSKNGSERVFSTASLRRWRVTSTNEESSTLRRRSSTAATPAQKKGRSCWENSTRQGDQDHGSGRPPWPSYRRLDCEW
jgi:hypothetical protein